MVIIDCRACNALADHGINIPLFTKRMKTAHLDTIHGVSSHPLTGGGGGGGGGGGFRCLCRVQNDFFDKSPSARP